MVELELEALIQSTRDLIESRPVLVTFERTVFERTLSGGVRKGTASDSDPQTFFFGTATDPIQITTDQGEQLVGTHVLVGMPDADMLEGDEFSIGSRNFRVAEIHSDRSYQVKGFVSERA